ncbi:hypothetical protein [Pantoea ananatis]|jgi:hypothetical protein|uniref:hypothetical protein n=1 Tax=Pantoea ananas TaxID=553 RepID=UPI00188E3C78|nr:hypothetical protein [Pantoea ananatis]
MKNKLLPTDYLNIKLGSYRPSTLSIKINKTQSDVTATGAGIESFNPRDCATLFHEFCHKLQNTSSIIGFQFFNLITSIWHNGRIYVYDSSDESSKKLNISAINILNKYRLNNNKILQKRKLLSITKIHGIDNIKEQEYTREPVAISYVYNDHECEFLFGIGEFYESCADVLERFFCTKINHSDLFSDADSVPYKTGESIAKFFNPKCSDYRLIILLLTSMQHSSPHQMFIMLSSIFSPSETSDEIVKNLCEEQARSLILLNKEWIALTKETIDNGFPIEDPFLGDLFKSISTSIEKNLMTRIENPFLELDFLDRITESNYKQELSHFIENFDGCVIYVDDQSIEPSGGSQKIIIGESSIFNQEREFMTFQCSILLAIKNLNDCSTFNEGSEYSCPVFDNCENLNKAENQHICLTAPHNHLKPDANGNNCPFQLATYKYDLKNHEANS